MKLKLIDLFAGAGGMTLGFTDDRFGGGFESVWAVDIDEAATRTFNANFGDHAVCEDIDDWVASGKPVPKADVVIGGPPCQGFSLLNKKRTGDTRRALWQPYMDVVEMSGARAFVIENVKELRSSPEHDDIVARANSMGLHRKDLPGKPDIVFPRYRAAIFVHGCFWHRHPDCSRASMPATNVEFWRAKFAKNVARDQRQCTQLDEMGWRVLVIWECETKDEIALSRRLRSFLAAPAVAG